MAANDPLNTSVPLDETTSAVGGGIGQLDVPAMKTLVTSVNDAKVGDPITQPMKDAAQTLGGALGS
ncbi:hypothetical protein ACWGII_29850 [Streptomyces sp. NPDC054855]